MTDETTLTPTATSTTTTDVKLTEMDSTKAIQEARAWGGGVLGVAILSMFILIAILIFVAWIWVQQGGIPDNSRGDFDWGQQGGGRYQKIVSSGFEFALWNDGDAYVVNRNTGAVSVSSVQYTNHKGSTMTFQDGILAIYPKEVKVTEALCYATASDLDPSASPFNLEISPNGTLFIVDANGAITPITSWNQGPIPTPSV